MRFWRRKYAFVGGVLDGENVKTHRELPEMVYASRPTPGMYDEYRRVDVRTFTHTATHRTPPWESE